MDCVKDFTTRDVKPDEVNGKLFFTSFRSRWLTDRRDDDAENGFAK